MSSNHRLWPALIILAAACLFRSPVLNAGWDSIFSAQLLQGSFFNPDIELLYPHTDDALSHLMIRPVSVYRSGAFSFTANLFAELDHFSGTSLPGYFQTTAGNSVHRHPDLDWEFKPREETGEVTGRGSIDQFYGVLHWKNTEWSIGRQPVNFQTCFYLSPNDFFMPFAAEAFDRIYRPGIDAAVIRIYPGNLSEISLIAAAGYLDRDLRRDRSACLIRGSVTWRNSEYTLLAGQLSDRKVAGFSFQGEAGIAGFRVETNYSDPDDPSRSNHAQASAGTDIRFSDRLHLFFEYMYWGNGADDPEDYDFTSADGGLSGPSYQGRHYSAAALSSQIHPLVNLSVLLIVNLSDGSGNTGVNLVYSLSDNADILAGALFPFGRKPDGGSSPAAIRIRSEYGLAPGSMFAELRFFI